MIVSLGITSLGFIGCGKKKEAVKAQQYVEFNDDMTDEELLEALRMINDEEIEDDLADAENAEEDAEADLEDAEAKLARAEDDLEDAEETLLEEEMEDDLEDIYRNMTPEEIEEAERQAMEELAALIAQEQEERSRSAMTGDMFDRNLDLEHATDEERAQFEEWQRTAAAWAQTELALAAEESAALGFKQIAFEKNSSVMLPGQEALLAANIECAREAIKNNHDLVVGAHAEADAPQALALSNARAAVLRDALLVAGLPADHIHAAGYGTYTIDPASQSMAEVIVC